MLDNTTKHFKFTTALELGNTQLPKKHQQALHHYLTHCLTQILVDLSQTISFL